MRTGLLEVCACAIFAPSRHEHPEGAAVRRQQAGPSGRGVRARKGAGSRRVFTPPSKVEELQPPPAEATAAAVSRATVRSADASCLGKRKRPVAAAAVAAGVATAGGSEAAAGGAR